MNVTIKQRKSLMLDILHNQVFEMTKHQINTMAFNKDADVEEMLVKVDAMIEQNLSDMYEAEKEIEKFYESLTDEEES